MRMTKTWKDFKTFKNRILIQEAFILRETETTRKIEFFEIHNRGLKMSRKDKRLLSNVERHRNIFPSAR